MYNINKETFRLSAHNENYGFNSANFLDNLVHYYTLCNIVLLKTFTYHIIKFPSDNRDKRSSRLPMCPN